MTHRSADVLPASAGARYGAVWDETEPAARRALIVEAFTEDAVYTDQFASVVGHDELDALVATVQAEFPDHTCVTAGVAGHQRLLRIAVRLTRPNSRARLDGDGIVELADDGRIRSVYVFLS
ncbi:nuclear transport factor 2 family protein [Yinghuangia seranimata]|uniref:nuclear transport factor 2 family protein n=1 Tax=Yinghuangia seranimata TaxID=408067 RepID=UPI00248AD01D|nr:nuclear transport factor 2 family protein [Yinghuangia seranimata]MDI2129872.1 nuclear transport factor 2 family protein [Yinghuangia seranimata]